VTSRRRPRPRRTECHHREIASDHEAEPGRRAGSEDAPPVEDWLREDAPAERAPAEPRERPPAPRPTRAGRAWVGLAIAAVLLIVLIVFLAENEHQVEISFLGASLSLPLGVALLAAAVCGSVVTLLVGGTRMVQLRREVRRERRRK
jgi:uncharacterized integral membrane protein